MTRRVHAYIDPRILVALGAEQVNYFNPRSGWGIWKWHPTFDQARLHVTLVAGGGSYIWEEGEPYDVTLASGRVTQRMRWRTLGKPTGASLPFPPLGEPACIASPALPSTTLGGRRITPCSSQRARRSCGVSQGYEDEDGIEYRAA